MAGAGAYGKMPALGDFFRIDLGDDFIGPWDRWLQTALATAKDRLGDRWDEGYMSAPIWRFVLQPGLAGTPARAGVLMPSVDRVGRRFPLVLAGSAPDGPPLAVHAAFAATFEALEELALEALEDGTTRDALAKGLSELDWPKERVAAPAARGPGTVAVRAGEEGDLVPRLAATLAPPGQGVWSAHVDGDHRLMLADGFPEGAAALALFDLDASLWAAAR